MSYYRIYGMAAGLFTAWTDYGWLYGTPQRVSELLGYLMTAGGQSYWFQMADVNGVAVIPTYPQQAGGGFPQWPGFPGSWTAQAA